MEDEVSIPLNTFASGNEWKRFSRSMCHPASVGDQARHVASKEKPPPVSMRLGEARELITRAALAWLERKAGLEP